MNAMYNARNIPPTQRPAPKTTIGRRSADETQVMISSNGTTDSARSLWFPATSVTPRHSVRRNTLLPTVPAITIPPCPRAPLIAETIFSGNVVAIDNTVTPTTVSERPTASAIEAASQARFYTKKSRLRCLTPRIGGGFTRCLGGGGTPNKRG